MIALLLGIVAARIVQGAPNTLHAPTRPDIVSTKPTVRLPSGTTIRMEVADEGMKHWRNAAGSPVPAFAFMYGMLNSLRESVPAKAEKGSWKALVARVSRKVVKDFPGGTFRVRDQSRFNGRAMTGYASLDTGRVDESSIGYLTFGSFPPGLRTTDVYFGYADGSWHVASSYDLSNKRGTGPAFFKGLSYESINNPLHGRGAGYEYEPKLLHRAVAKVNIPTPLKESDFRIRAYEANGSSISEAGSISDPGHDAEYYFDISDSSGNPRLSRVVRIELQTRPYTWILFKNVQLRGKP